MPDSSALHVATITSEPSVNLSSVLFVDLDGTLVSTDLLHESLLLAVKRSPRFFLRAPALVRQGRAVFKHELSQCVQPDAAVLPYRADVVAYLKEQRAAGRRIILATASSQRWARAVADHLGIFDDVLASDGIVNLKSSAKLAAMQAYCQQHGYPEFGYIGDSAADLPIWQAANEVHIAPARSLVRSQARRLQKSGREFTDSGHQFRAAINALRPQQWAKNILLFVPLLLSHQAENLTKLFSCCLAFVAFSAFASAVYLMNDLLDIESDRHHARKRRRPFAAGTLPVMYGPIMAASLIVLGLTISIVALPWPFLFALIGYALINVLYSFWLKQKLALDVILLASMYALRVVVGGLATDVAVSEWLLAFSLFFFTSLAFAKRYAELLNISTTEVTSSRGRGYTTADLSMIESLGPTSGYMAVLVLALYINSQNMKQLYPNPWALWAICPLLMYWITRTWFIAKRGEMNEDPLVYALRDRVSIGIGLLTLALGVIATLF